MFIFLEFKKKKKKKEPFCFTLLYLKKLIRELIPVSGKTVNQLKNLLSRHNSI